MVRWLDDALCLTWKGHLWIHKCTNALLPNYPWKGNMRSQYHHLIPNPGHNVGLPGGEWDGYHKYQPTSHSPVIPYSAYRQIGITWHNQQWDPGAIHSQHGSRRSQNPSVWLDCFPAVARHWRSLPNLGGRDDLGEPPVLIWWETNGKMTTAYNGINYLQQFK